VAQRGIDTAFQRTPSLEAGLRDVIQAHADQPGALMPVLQAAQELYGYLPVDVQKTIAEGLGLPLSQVTGVVGFHDFLKADKGARYTIRACRNLPCHVRAAKETLEAFEKILGIMAGETTADGKFELVACDCLGVCDKSPAVMVNGTVFGPIRPSEVASFLSRFG
jgi:NADH:ubiquinone oxidoreductase subunit E